MSPPTSETKTCRACGETKPIGEFRKHSHRDGVRTICRPCENVEQCDQRMRSARPPKPLAHFLIGHEEWKDRAACAGANVDKFFPTKGQSGHIAAVKKICAGCPVREDCLAYDEKTGPQPGIWGGLTEGERRKLRKQQRGAAA